MAPSLVTPLRFLWVPFVPLADRYNKCVCGKDGGSVSGGRSPALAERSFHSCARLPHPTVLGGRESLRGGAALRASGATPFPLGRRGSGSGFQDWQLEAQTVLHFY